MPAQATQRSTGLRWPMQIRKPNSGNITTPASPRCEKKVTKVLSKLSHGSLKCPFEELKDVFTHVTQPDVSLFTAWRWGSHPINDIFHTSQDTFSLLDKYGKEVDAIFYSPFFALRPTSRTPGTGYARRKKIKRKPPVLQAKQGPAW